MSVSRLKPRRASLASAMRLQLNKCCHGHVTATKDSAGGEEGRDTPTSSERGGFAVVLEDSLLGTA